MQEAEVKVVGESVAGHLELWVTVRWLFTYHTHEFERFSAFHKINSIQMSGV